jgi:hypothetical protein
VPTTGIEADDLSQGAFQKGWTEAASAVAMWTSCTFWPMQCAASRPTVARRGSGRLNVGLAASTGTVRKTIGPAPDLGNTAIAFLISPCFSDAVGSLGRKAGASLLSPLCADGGLPRTFSGVQRGALDVGGQSHRT